MSAAFYVIKLTVESKQTGMHDYYMRDRYKFCGGWMDNSDLRMRFQTKAAAQKYLDKARQADPKNESRFDAAVVPDDLPRPTRQ